MIPFFIFYSLSLGAAFLYGGLILSLIKAWRSIPVFEPLKKEELNVSISVIIPARNEAANIRACLNAIAKQDYPSDLFEIIVVDDHSTDATAERVRQLGLPNLILLQLADHPSLDQQAGFKKQAISWAIEHARGELIVTTDADCLAPPTWLSYLASCYQKEKCHFIAAPVVFYPTLLFLENFQALDFLGMMLLTGAGIQTNWFYMSNGANLAYSKKSYQAVGGFQGIGRRASGDDMLLMHKIMRHFPGGACFVKATLAVVRTSAQPDLSSFLQQRLRWASKSDSYANWRLIAILGLVFFLCWSILLSPIAALFWRSPALLAGVLLFSIKSWIDYRLLSTAARFFNRQNLLKYFWASQIAHILYIAGIGLLANLKKNYVWKGRRVK